MSVIRIVFEGMLVMFVNDGRKHCDVGILDDAPGHTTRLIVNEITQGDPEEIARLEDDELESSLWLEVAKPPERLKIELVEHGNNPPDRHGPPSDDFRWALDFEGPEMYAPNRVDVDESAFSSILRINDGMFSTKQVSQNELTKQTSGGKPTGIGKVATKLLAVITLTGSDTAELRNGTARQPLASFADNPGIDYGIYVGKTRPHGHTMPLTDRADAENYYNALAGNIPPGQKLHFGAGARLDPDARCLTAWMSLTQLP